MPYLLSSSRKSPPLRLHLLHPIPSFSLGRASVFTSKLHFVTLVWAPVASVRHSRFEHRGSLVAPEPANYVYVSEVRETRHLTARSLFHAVVRVRACQSQGRSTHCSAHSFPACSCTSVSPFGPDTVPPPQNPLAIPSRQTSSLFLRSISFASLVRAYEVAGLGSPLVPSPGDTTTFLSPRVDPILDSSLYHTIFTNRRQNGWSVAPLFDSPPVERASR